MAPFRTHLRILAVLGSWLPASMAFHSPIAVTSVAPARLFPATFQSQVFPATNAILSPVRVGRDGWLTKLAMQHADSKSGASAVRKATSASPQLLDRGTSSRAAKSVVSSEDSVILDHMSDMFFLDSSDDRGSFIGFTAPRASSLFDLNLGKLHCRRLLACSRQKLWWMNPSWGTSASDVPAETQFMLLQMHDDGDQNEEYAIILPLVTGPFRTCLTSGKGGNLHLRVESGDANTVSSHLENAVFVASGRDPFELLKHSFAAVADRLQTFCVRGGKELPPSLDQFGWCTWDAFYSDVDGAGIMQGLQALKQGGVPARTLIIDDGWQDTAHDEDARKKTGFRARTRSAVQEATRRFTKWYSPKLVEGAEAGSAGVAVYGALANGVLRKPVLANFVASADTSDFTKRLQSPEASARFADSLPGSFKEFVQHIKREFGLREVYCWHALFGYWSGIQPSAALGSEESPFSAQSAAVRRPQPMGGILRVEPQLAWDPLTLNGVGMVQSQAAGRLYAALHSYLAECGVDGVKVDAQSLATMMGSGIGGASHTARSFVQAMEKSVASHFGSSANCINCMCHATECLYSYKDTAVGRASDDFWPRDPASQTVHIANVAYNSLFIGEILQPDWDMFQSSHESAALHAVARAVGGCAVYVSDKPGEHNFRLLRRLVLPDGSVLRAKLPGRPTRDSLFADVVGDGRSALKIWNRNACGGVLAAMNVQGARWDRQARRNVLEQLRPATVEATVRVTDIAGLAEAGEAGGEAQWAVLATRWRADGELESMEKRVVEAQEAWAMSLGAKESAVCTVAAVRSAVGEGGRPVRWAALGLEGMLNGGAAVEGERERVRVGAAGSEGAAGAVDAEVELSGGGTLLLHCEAAPQRVLSDGEERAFEFSETEALLRVRYSLEETSSRNLQLQIQF